MIATMKQLHGFFILVLPIVTIVSTNSYGQNEGAYMRIAKITVDSSKLDNYKAALKEQIQAALQFEKGVLAYSAVQDKKNPSKITILETYASVDAYHAHTQTEHFKKYKTTVANMVKELELSDVVPIAIQSKVK
ncbi:MAG: putative quinol monooxygenase [Cyclobacteriaceae bacterium]